MGNGTTLQTKTPDEVRAHIDAAQALASVVVTFTAAGWAQNSTDGCYYQTVTCSGILTTDGKRASVSPVGSTDAAAQKLTDEAEAMVDRYSCDTNGQLKARCPDGKPGVNFQVSVDIVRKP